MPDLLLVFFKKWKLIFALTSVATAIALVVALIAPKKYAATATALPANAALSDKARIFNQNIEALYSDMGSPDDLDRILGTAALDTVFIAIAKELNLPSHYSIAPSNESIYRAAKELKKNSTISRSAYGELKVKVLDKDKLMAADLANYLLNKLQQLHQSLLNTTNVLALDKLKESYAQKQKEYVSLAQGTGYDSLSSKVNPVGKEFTKARMAALAEQMQQYERSIDEYELAINTHNPVLLIVEKARPPLKADKPDVLSIVAFTFCAALLFSLLLVLFLESRKYLA